MLFVDRLFAFKKSINSWEEFLRFFFATSHVNPPVEFEQVSLNIFRNGMFVPKVAPIFSKLNKNMMIVKYEKQVAIFFYVFAPSLFTRLALVTDISQECSWILSIGCITSTLFVKQPWISFLLKISDTPNHSTLPWKFIIFPSYQPL